MDANLFYDMLVTLTTALASLAIVLTIYGQYLSMKKKGSKS